MGSLELPPSQEKGPLRLAWELRRVLTVLMWRQLSWTDLSWFLMKADGACHLGIQEGLWERNLTAPGMETGECSCQSQGGLAKLRFGVERNQTQRSPYYRVSQAAVFRLGAAATPS